MYSYYEGCPCLQDPGWFGGCSAGFVCEAACEDLPDAGEEVGPGEDLRYLDDFVSAMFILLGIVSGYTYRDRSQKQDDSRQLE